jgi:hypothetical protein
MLNKFIKNSAIKTWQKELENFIDVFSTLSDEERANYFIWGVKTRAGAQIEGMFLLPDGTSNKSVELIAYPIMLEQFEGLVKYLDRNVGPVEAAGVVIWVHTLRGIIHPELRPLAKQMWENIMQTQHLWNGLMRKHYQLDVESGIDVGKLKATYTLASDIIEQTPPRLEVM